jgi:hypothetical protein
MHKHFLPYFVFSCLLLLAAGCGQNCRLKGKVVFSDDQSPLTQGTVCLISDAGIARGPIGSDGSYEVGSLSDKDGLPPGTYQIYLTETEIYEPVPGAGLPRRIVVIDEKYSQANTSGLSVEVKSSMTHNIEVDRFQGASR